MYKDIKISELKEFLSTADLPVCVTFTERECAQCEALEPAVARVAEHLEGKMIFVRADVTGETGKLSPWKVRSLPTVAFYDKGTEVCSRLSGWVTGAEVSEIAEHFFRGLCVHPVRSKVNTDVLILGAGPAGLTAAMYTARARLMTVVLEESLPGGQVATTWEVANYPGTDGVVKGLDLMENMKKQALSFGARIDDMKQVRVVKLTGEVKVVSTDDADYFARTVIIATGAEPRKLPAEGEHEYRGKGVHYCATCDGAMYTGADICVIGGGESALEEAVFLTRFASKITVINRSGRFRASQAAQKEVLEHEAVSVLWNTEVRKVTGNDFVTAIELENTDTGETQTLPTEGLFVYIGMVPKTAVLEGQIRMDPWGYIETDEDLMTSIPGVFAAGDVRVKKVRQIATAVGDGALAGVLAERWLHQQSTEA